MSIKQHDENDDQHGLDPKVKADINRETRELARGLKRFDQTVVKAGKYLGNGGKR